MERLKNYKTLSYPEIDRKRGFDEIVNSPIYRNYVISEDGKTSGIVVYLQHEIPKDITEVAPSFLDFCNKIQGEMR